MNKQHTHKHKMTNGNQAEMLYHQITTGKSTAILTTNPTTTQSLRNDKQHTRASSLSSSSFLSGVHFKFQMILVVLIFCLFTSCIKYANTQETNYFYTDGKRNFSFSVF